MQLDILLYVASTLFKFFMLNFIFNSINNYQLQLLFGNVFIILSFIIFNDTIN